ncbi:MAG: hypothetical protein JSV66_00740 [Trueperaceae bacterium]|nr:MAG: hypothetical protein JSV66_00740 [Trueperaceae bacterium]
MASARLLAVLVLFGVNVALAQICQAELSDGLGQEELSAPVSGVDAAVHLRVAVELVEPALPRFVQARPLPISAGEPGHEAALFLAERRLLPPSWQPQDIDRQTWQQMINSFLHWYRIDPLPLAEPNTVGDLIADLTLVLERVSKAIRPAAMIAADPRNENRISFLAIIWNWTVYPRLLVVNPPDGLSLDGGMRPVMAAMGNCVLRLETFIYAPEQTAKSLFLTHNESRMIIASSAPDQSGVWPLWVDEGEELNYFGFLHPDVADLEVYAAVFDGPEVGIPRMLSLFPRIRTNISPLGFLKHLEIPAMVSP